MTDGQNWLPEPDEHSRPYFAAMQSGNLCLQRCVACDTWMFPHRRRCQSCGAPDLTWQNATGRGTIFSHAKLQREYHPRHAGRLPLVIAQIDLDEGVRMSSNVIGIDPENVRVGQRVAVEFERFPDGGLLPVFRIVD